MDGFHFAAQVNLPVVILEDTKTLDSNFYGRLKSLNSLFEEDKELDSLRMVAFKAFFVLWSKYSIQDPSLVQGSDVPVLELPRDPPEC